MRRRPRLQTDEDRRDYLRTLELLAEAVARRPTSAPLQRHFVLFVVQ